MLVVVYLTDAKKNIIIPQDWIMALNQETLNNVGKASYQNRRIFWTSHGLSNDEIPDDSIAPNFCLPLSKTFPPPEGITKTCYIARVKRYCATEATAKIFRDKFRAVLPIRYIVRRQSDEPTPPTSPTSSASNDQSDSEPNYSQNSAGTSSSRIRETESHNMNDSNQAAQTNSPEIQTESVSEISSDEVPIEVDGTSTDSGGSSEVKNIMPNVEMGEEESFAIESVFSGDYDDENSNDSMNTDGNASDSDNTDEPQLNLAPGEKAFWDDGVLKVKKKYDRDCEITYTYGEKVAPKTPMFEVKLKDLISMNIPFKENGNGDRAYLVQTKDGSKEVHLASRAVIGLRHMNSESNRANRGLDKAFIKVLLVSLIGIQHIKDHGIDKDVLKLIKSLFVVRVGKDDDEKGSRYLSFSRLVDLASNQIKENNFKK